MTQFEKTLRELEGMRVLMVNTNQGGFTALQKMRHENALRELTQKIEELRKKGDVRNN